MGVAALPRNFKATLLSLIASATLAWTFMTPFGGVADEAVYSIYSNVVASGQGYGRSDVPSYVQGLAYLTCFAFKPAVTANCQQQTPWESLGDKPVTIGSEGMIGGYPEPYFWLVGQPSRIFSGFPAVYLMRLIAWASGMLLVALMVIFWPVRHRVSLVMATLLVSTPMVGSFVGAINPNGFEIISGFSLAGLLSALMLKSGEADQSPRSSAMHLVAIFIAMVSLSVAKPYSFVFTLVITFAFLVTAGVVALQNKWCSASVKETGFRRPVLLWLLGLLGLSVTIGYASNETYRNVMAALGTKAGVVSIWESNLKILGHFTGYALELIGILGWRDHDPPLFVLVLWAAALIAFVMYVSGRLLLAYRFLFLGFIIGVLWIIPVFSNQVLGLLGGAGFQARYVGAIFCAIPFIAIAYLYLSGRPLEFLPAAELAPALVCWFFMLQIATIAWSFLRFSVGFPLSTQGGILNNFQWFPNYWIITVLALAVFFGTSIVLFLQLRSQANTAELVESRD